MKKVILLVLSIILVVSFVMLTSFAARGIGGGNPDTEWIDDDDFEEIDDEETTEAKTSKRKNEYWCDGEHIDFEYRKEKVKRTVGINNITFYIDTDGNNVVLLNCPNRCGKDMKNRCIKYLDVRTFAPVEPTAETFAQIKSGMHLYEVVELVGIPLPVGMTDGRMMFATTSGEQYVISFYDICDSSAEGYMIVKSVKQTKGQCTCGMGVPCLLDHDQKQNQIITRYEEIIVDGEKMVIEEVMGVIG